MLEDAPCEAYTKSDGAYWCRYHERELVDRKTLETMHGKVDKPVFDGKIYCPLSGIPFKF
jgi:hypothetical protein